MSGSDGCRGAQVSVAESSPSTTAISTSDLYKKGLCDYGVNVADGCRHGCSFCYVRSSPPIRYDPGGKYANAGIDDPAGDWGNFVLYRDGVVEATARDCQRISDDDWRTTERGQGVVGVSFLTDCYMDPRAAKLTRGVVAAIVGHHRPVRVLTRNPKLLADLHGDFYAALPSDLVTVGTSIPGLDAGKVRALERGTPPVEQRFRGLEALDDSVPTFVSMGPTYPSQDASDLRTLLATISDRLDPEVVFHEPLNPRSGNIGECIEQARACGESGLADALEAIRDRDNWRRYALRHLRDVQRAAEDVGQQVHLWPDETLAKNAPRDAREWCMAWRERPSPEAIGDGPACDDEYPGLPRMQSALDTFGGGE